MVWHSGSGKPGGPAGDRGDKITARIREAVRQGKIMYDTIDMLEEDLSDLDPGTWMATLADLARDQGWRSDLGPRHLSAFVSRGSTLLVSFETVQGVFTLSDRAQPLGFEMVRSQDWSHLCLISDGDTWFRDRRIYALFDRLTDEGFFDRFHKILFYGAGPCGYAAAAYSVAAPGARVLAVQPQATLDPRDTGWDDRFSEMRRLCFTDRYGYAPDMIEAAASAYVLYDPYERQDAMHAALFRRPNVLPLRMPFMGTALQTDLIELGILYRLIVHAAAGKLTPHGFSRLMRARRTYPPYLRNLLGRLDRDERPYLGALLCENVVRRLEAPKIQRRLQALKAEAEAGGFQYPGT